MDAWAALLDSLGRLAATWPGGPWTWDARLAAIASTFDAPAEPTARASAMHAFPRGWTTASIGNAPPELAAVAERTGGLRARQRLLGGDAGLFGLWWPWGGGDRITLRIGVVDRDAAAEPMPRIRALFGVAP